LTLHVECAAAIAKMGIVGNEIMPALATVWQGDCHAEFVK
jgi:hypothetical protein